MTERVNGLLGGMSPALRWACEATGACTLASSFFGWFPPSMSSILQVLAVTWYVVMLWQAGYAGFIWLRKGGSNG